jgi:hypothetical protein
MINVGALVNGAPGAHTRSISLNVTYIALRSPDIMNTFMVIPSTTMGWVVRPSLKMSVTIAPVVPLRYSYTSLMLGTRDAVNDVVVLLNTVCGSASASFGGRCSGGLKGMFLAM